jgi:hypothetical protein
MLAGMGTVANSNQDNPQAVQGQMETSHETTGDVAKGKVNPVESPDNLSDKSDLNRKTHSEDVPNRASGEERIIDVMG